MSSLIRFKSIQVANLVIVLGPLGVGRAQVGAADRQLSRGGGTLTIHNLLEQPPEGNNRQSEPDARTDNKGRI